MFLGNSISFFSPMITNCIETSSIKNGGYETQYSKNFSVHVVYQSALTEVTVVTALKKSLNWNTVQYYFVKNNNGSVTV